MIKDLTFTPFPFLASPHAQTIVSSLIRPFRHPLSEQKLVSLPDGDLLSLEITTPQNWHRKKTTVFLIHGLCGSHTSSYLVRMVKRLSPLGIRTVRINMRGCGSGKGLAKKFYHAGRSADVLESLKAVNAEKAVLIGYSLGGNIALKLSSEIRTAHLKKVIAVSPSVDLIKNIQVFNHPRNAIYQQRFSRLLRSHALDLHPHLSIPKNLTIYEFDESVTAPLCGFKSACDYYSQCSSISLISQIELPCHLLFAEDDPIVPHTSLDGMKLPSKMEIFKTKKGGHLGYLGNPFCQGGVHWLDSLLVQWIEEL